jgi:hypothetical protein
MSPGADGAGLCQFCPAAAAAEPGLVANPLGLYGVALGLSLAFVGVLCVEAAVPPAAAALLPSAAAAAAGELRQLLLLLVVPSSDTAAVRCLDGQAASNHDIEDRTARCCCCCCCQGGGRWCCCCCCWWRSDRRGEAATAPAASDTQASAGQHSTVGPSLSQRTSNFPADGTVPTTPTHIQHSYLTATDTEGRS